MTVMTTTTMRTRMGMRRMKRMMVFGEARHRQGRAAAS
jgi:hypothetical protein